MGTPYTTSPCPNCGEEMRYPLWGGEFSIACPRCGWQHDNGKVPPPPMNKAGIYEPARAARRRAEQDTKRYEKKRKREEWRRRNGQAPSIGVDEHEPDPDAG